ncbi:hypothetical protein FCM35_KLT03672 [Carex littledalei]|uniref:Transmembrane protein n=1 Tax=Carex littledalei TaxID=544730 RepID=A0A833QYD1_9POAL|nr:hypothetical protein FCM35_KLT03672 [Carex littledalei]
MYYNNAYSSRRSYYGPSPVIPCLIIGGLVLVIFWDALCEWYEYASEVKGSIESNVPIIIFVALVVLMFLFGFITDAVAVIIPLAGVLVILPFLNEITIVLVLLVVITFLGLHYYPPHKSVSNGWGRSQPTFYPGTSHSWGSNESNLPLGLSSGLLCYLIMISCLFICITYYEDEGSRWICLALVLVIVLFFSLSGFGDERSNYPVKKTGLYSWNWLRSFYQPRNNVGLRNGKDFDWGFSLSLGLFCYLVMVVCIFFCMVFCNIDVYWCFSFALVLLIVLFFNYSEPEIRKL